MNEIFLFFCIRSVLFILFPAVALAVAVSLIILKILKFQTVSSLHDFVRKNTNIVFYCIVKSHCSVFITFTPSFVFSSCSIYCSFHVCERQSPNLINGFLLISLPFLNVMHKLKVQEWDRTHRQATAIGNGKNELATTL